MPAHGGSNKEPHWRKSHENIQTQFLGSGQQQRNDRDDGLGQFGPADLGHFEGQSLVKP